MSTQRSSRILAVAAVGLLLAALPTRAAAQGAGCTTHSCTAVHHVQVTVPTRLGLSGAGPRATVNANTAWRLDVSAVETNPSKVTEIQDTPAASSAAVRYTLVGT